MSFNLIETHKDEGSMMSGWYGSWQKYCICLMLENRGWNQYWFKIQIKTYVDGFKRQTPSKHCSLGWGVIPAASTSCPLVCLLHSVLQSKESTVRGHFCRNICTMECNPIQLFLHKKLLLWCPYTCLYCFHTVMLYLEVFLTLSLVSSIYFLNFSSHFWNIYLPEYLKDERRLWQWRFCLIPYRKKGYDWVFYSPLFLVD